MIAIGAGIACHAKRIEPRVGAHGPAVVGLDSVDVGCRGTLRRCLVVGGGLLRLGGRQGKSAGSEEPKEGKKSDRGLLRKRRNQSGWVKGY